MGAFRAPRFGPLCLWLKHGCIQRRLFGSDSIQQVSWRRGENLETRPLLSNHKFDPGLFPLKGVLVDDTTRASTASRFIRSGQALIFEGDYHNARQLLAALKRRVTEATISTRNHGALNVTNVSPVALEWKKQRRVNQEPAKQLNMVLVMVESDHALKSNRRAPNVSELLESHFGTQRDGYLIPLREVIGMVGAHEWQKKGVYVPQIEDFIYPHYGVFVPTRREYLDLLLNTPSPSDEMENATMLEVGVGTGVISALMLLRRNVQRVVGTDINPNAISCANENLTRMGLSDRVELVEANLFPSEGTMADLIVCNPPWIPGSPDSWLDFAVYDEDLSMLRGFLAGAKRHLRTNQSEVWLVLSNMAELLELRTRQELMQMIDDGNFVVEHVYETHPVHKKALGRKRSDETSAISAARAAERTFLFRLRQKSQP